MCLGISISQELSARIESFIISNAKSVKHLESALKNPLVLSAVRKERVYYEENSVTIENEHFFTYFDNYWESKKESTKKQLGIEFTSEGIADDIVRLTIENIEEGDRILDPAVGSGVFLRSCLDHLYKKYQIQPSYTVQNILYGSDIVDDYVYATKLGLLLKVFSMGYCIDEIDADNIKCGNALKIYDTRLKYVIGNPPYIKWQLLDDETRIWLMRNYSKATGTYNIYLAFMEHFLSLLEDGGRLGFIVPNGILTSRSAADFRDWLYSNYRIEYFIDFSDSKLFKASAYSCIIILSKASPKKNFRLLRAKSLEELKDANYLEALIKPTEKIWHVVTNEESDHIKKIEFAGKRLGEYGRISTGIATLKDNIYTFELTEKRNGRFIKRYKGLEFEIEPEIVRPLIKVSRKDLNLGIIFPYRNYSGRIELIDEVTMQRCYPHTLEYLAYARKELEQRDKGRRSYGLWYAYGRTQNLDNEGVKILTPTFSKKPAFFIEWDPKRLFCNGYGIIFKTNKTFNKNQQTVLMFNDTEFLSEIDKVKIEFFTRVLNSKVMEYYISLTSENLSGGYKCYQKKYIERFSVPDLCRDELQDLLKADELDFQRKVWRLYDLPDKVLTDLLL
ncbi:MAG TPA: N-6 DNA methylase [Mesotoga sp.]|jgi:adenine-specific DNA-methyltransferase|nr:N-6 DNA methylase [Mesotoga sp.]